MATPLNDTQFNPQQIQYLPGHHCPQCGSQPRRSKAGFWFQPYQDWFNTTLGSFQDHLGYVFFQCSCQHHPEFRGVLRVVRLGEAILPVHFAGFAAARRAGMEPAEINTQRTRQALAYLALHADPARAQDAGWFPQSISVPVAGPLSHP